MSCIDNDSMQMFAKVTLRARKILCEIPNSLQDLKLSVKSQNSLEDPKYKRAKRISALSANVVILYSQLLFQYQILFIMEISALQKKSHVLEKFSVNRLKNANELRN